LPKFITMDFKDHLKTISDRIIALKDQIHTEEATKNAFIMPFLQSLGYDVFNPLEVVPEYVTDIGTKKGEKIDYLILREGQPIILIECKHHKENLDLHDGQLLRYFHVSKAKFGMLTNGIEYRFYTDLVSPNKMDEKPFLSFNLTDVRDNHIEELKKFQKSTFDVANIVNTASELKYMGELKNVLASELTNPSDTFVKHFAKQVYDGMITPKVAEQFTSLLKRTISLYFSELIQERFKIALNQEKQNEANAANDVNAIEPISVNNDKTVETTVEELEGFFIVRSLLRNHVEVTRIAQRDNLNYFSVLLDDNNRKPICRLYFNGKKKQIGIFGENKEEVKFEVNSLDDIFKHGDSLIRAVQILERKESNPTTSAI
jgi:hypothetical protein